MTSFDIDAVREDENAIVTDTVVVTLRLNHAVLELERVDVGVKLRDIDNLFVGDSVAAVFVASIVALGVGELLVVGVLVFVGDRDTVCDGERVDEEDDVVDGVLLCVGVRDIDEVTSAVLVHVSDRTLRVYVLDCVELLLTVRRVLLTLRDGVALGVLD